MSVYKRDRPVQTRSTRWSRLAPLTTPGRRRFMLGLALSGGIALLAYRRRSLTKSGSAGMVVVGTTIFGQGGWRWGLSLIYFFVSSTLFSHFREQEKEQTAADKFSKGSERDVAQVAANGGVATLFAALAGSTHSKPLQQTLEAGFVGALATATADTWATELGVLSPDEPRLLTTGEPVVPGTSGGITRLGSLASALGALTLGLVHWSLHGPRKALARLPLISLLSGMAGSLCDSFLGATVQAMYFCPTCQSETERLVHSCGTRTELLRGRSWCDNDVVNFFATLAGSLVAMALHVILSLFGRKRSK